MQSTSSICYCIWHTYAHVSVRSFRVIEEVLSNTWVELAVASDITVQKCFLILMLGLRRTVYSTGNPPLVSSSFKPLVSS